MTSQITASALWFLALGGKLRGSLRRRFAGATPWWSQMWFLKLSGIPLQLLHHLWARWRFPWHHWADCSSAGGSNPGHWDTVTLTTVEDHNTADHRGCVLWRAMVMIISFKIVRLGMCLCWFSYNTNLETSVWESAHTLFLLFLNVTVCTNLQFLYTHYHQTPNQ